MKGCPKRKKPQKKIDIRMDSVYNEAEKCSAETRPMRWTAANGGECEPRRFDARSATSKRPARSRTGAPVTEQASEKIGWYRDASPLAWGGVFFYRNAAAQACADTPLDCKEIQPVHSKGDQSWVFFRRSDAKAETPVLWPSQKVMLCRHYFF